MSNYDNPGPLDGVIDEAVREMMQLDPRPGLRSRVNRAIRGPRQRSHGFRLGFAAIAIVTVVLASLLLLRSPDSATPVPSPQVAATTPAAPAPLIAGPQAVETPTPVVPPAAAARPRPGPLPTPESIFGPRRQRVAATSIPKPPIPSFVEEAWLGFTAGTAELVALTPITLVPIQVAPLAIRPLVVGGQATRK